MLLLPSNPAINGIPSDDDSLGSWSFINKQLLHLGYILLTLFTDSTYTPFFSVVSAKTVITRYHPEIISATVDYRLIDTHSPPLLLPTWCTTVHSNSHRTPDGPPPVTSQQFYKRVPFVSPVSPLLLFRSIHPLCTRIEFILLIVTTFWSV